MLSHLLQASISAKMILINFEVYNEYGDKRKCKAVVNEGKYRFDVPLIFYTKIIIGSTFHDLASKIRINPDHYKIHLMGDKQKTSWADQVLEKHQNKTFFATFYDVSSFYGFHSQFEYFRRIKQTPPTTASLVSQVTWRLICFF